MKSADTASLIAALLWVIPFALGRHFRLGASRFRRGVLSAAAGIAIAYVFVDFLPQMQRAQETFSTAAVGHGLPFPHYRVYFSALLGFILYYALDNFGASTRPERQERGADASSLAYRLHILGYAVYFAAMGYLLQVEAEARARVLTLYSLAMFLHFWVVDHALRREFGAPYDRSGRWILATAVLAGWALGILGVSSDLLVPTVTGLIGGGVVINSIKEELPEKGEGQIGPFALGAFGYALVLMAIG